MKLNLSDRMLLIEISETTLTVEACAISGYLSSRNIESLHIFTAVMALTSCWTRCSESPPLNSVHLTSRVGPVLLHVIVRLVPSHPGVTVHTCAQVHRRKQMLLVQVEKCSLPNLNQQMNNTTAPSSVRPWSYQDGLKKSTGVNEATIDSCV